MIFDSAYLTLVKDFCGIIDKNQVKLKQLFEFKNDYDVDLWFESKISHYCQINEIEVPDTNLMGRFIEYCTEYLYTDERCSKTTVELLFGPKNRIKQ